MPTIPDGWLHLLSTPLPCVLGLAPHQRGALPDPPPEFMAIFDLDAPSCTLPSAPLPMLPPREASGLIEQLREAHANATGQVAPPDFSSTRRPPPAIADGGDGIGPVSQRLPPRFEGLVRAAFADFFVSLLRDLHLHVPDPSAHAADADGNGDGDGDGDGGGGDGEADGNGAAAAADLLDAQLEAFVDAQPEKSRGFLRQLVRTQHFLCFVEPPTADGGGGGGGQRRGGRFFQRRLDAYLREQLAGRLPSDGKELEQLAALLPAAAALAPAAATPMHASAEASAAARLPLYETPPPVAPAGARAPPYVYDRVPRELPPSLCAAQLPLPAFAGEELPPPRVSPQVRDAWVVALAELERRDEKRRQSALVAEGAGVGLAVTIGTGVLVAGACCVQ